MTDHGWVQVGTQHYTNSYAPAGHMITINYDDNPLPIPPHDETCRIDQSCMHTIDPGIGTTTFTVHYRVVGRSINEQMIDLANQDEQQWTSTTQATPHHGSPSQD